MDEQPRPRGPFYWILGGLLLTVFNSSYGMGLNMEDSDRHNAQSIFHPSPPLLPQWIFYTIYVFLAVQVVFSIIGVWRVQKGRIWVAAIYVILWLSALKCALTGFG